MSEAKYIIVEEHGLELPIVFNSILTHLDVAGSRKVMGAGFCSIGTDDKNNRRWTAYGRSVSLQVASRPQDTDILNTSLFVG